jgi:hypothetical protein
MRYGFVVMCLLVSGWTSALAQLSIGIDLPGVSIGVNLPIFPELVRMPGYPVYYAPRVDSNFFFFDGMYWVYQSDNWYASSWYNGPWGFVAPESVPLFVLRIPVRYYRAPPAYFRGWRADAPPRWGEHWGNEWEQRHSGWDHWSRSSAPAPAPLPVYQRQYSGERYPRAEQQQVLHSKNYRYQPQETIVRQHYQEKAGQGTSAPSQHRSQDVPQEHAPRSQEVQRSTTAPSFPQNDPAGQTQRPAPQQRAAQPEQQTPRTSQERIPQGNSHSQEPHRRQSGPEPDRERGEGRGQEHNR